MVAAGETPEDAVADILEPSALSWEIENVGEFDYGSETEIPFDPADPGATEIPFEDSAESSSVEQRPDAGTAEGSPKAREQRGRAEQDGSVE